MRGTHNDKLMIAVIVLNVKRIQTDSVNRNFDSLVCVCDFDFSLIEKCYFGNEFLYQCFISGSHSKHDALIQNIICPVTSVRRN